MRTTIDLDRDVLLAVKEIARQRGVTIGKVLSELARQAMTQPGVQAMRDGIPLFPMREDGGPVTLTLINQLRDEEA